MRMHMRRGVVFTQAPSTHPCGSHQRCCEASVCTMASAWTCSALESFSQRCVCVCVCVCAHMYDCFQLHHDSLYLSVDKAGLTLQRGP